eukprot:scaffold31815_cov118-Isochrysis_galbana.AAC.8
MDENKTRQCRLVPAAAACKCQPPSAFGAITAASSAVPLRTRSRSRVTPAACSTVRNGACACATPIMAATLGLSATSHRRSSTVADDSRSRCSRSASTPSPRATRPALEHKTRQGAPASASRAAARRPSSPKPPLMACASAEMTGASPLDVEAEPPPQRMAPFRSRSASAPAAEMHSWSSPSAPRATKTPSAESRSTPGCRSITLVPSAGLSIRTARARPHAAPPSSVPGNTAPTAPGVASCAPRVARSSRAGFGDDTI